MHGVKVSKDGELRYHYFTIWEEPWSRNVGVVGGASGVADYLKARGPGLYTLTDLDSGTEVTIWQCIGYRYADGNKKVDIPTDSRPRGMIAVRQHKR